jgi:phosphotriesterase-related protein
VVLEGDGGAQAGAILEYDTFGSDFLYGTPRLRNPSDVERLEMAVWLLSEGYAEQLVLACDTWTKANLKRNGGFGYEHLFRRIVPALQDLAGADDATMETIMVHTPRRLLTR